MKKIVVFFGLICMLLSDMFLAAGCLSVSEHQQVMITVEMEADASQSVQIYYKSSENDAFLEDNSSTAWYDAEDGTQELTFTVPANMTEMRLDFELGSSAITIYDISAAYKEQSILLTAKELAHPLLQQDIESFSVENDIYVETENGDPYLVWSVAEYGLSGMVQDQSVFGNFAWIAMMCFIMDALILLVILLCCRAYREGKSEITERIWIQSAVPVWILFAVLELLFVLAWTGPLPDSPKWAAAFASLYFFAGFLCAVPIVQKMISFIEQLIWDKVKAVKQFPWRKNFVIIVIDVVLALAAERVMTRCMDGSFQAISGRRWLFCFAIIFIVSIFLCCREMMKKNVETAVFLVILTIGTAFIGVLPACCGLSWDDETHYEYADSISHVLDQKTSAANNIVLNDFAATALEHYLYTDEEYDEWIQEIETVYDSGEYIPIQEIRPVFKNFCYIPSALGLVIGRALSLPYHMIFQLGRWMNLFVYAGIIYFAIRRLKSGKMLAAVIALLPFNMTMAMTYSRDPWMIALSMYGFCYLIGELQQPEKKLEWKDIVFMVGSVFLGLGAKAIYAFIMLTFLAMPKKKFSSKGQRRIFYLIVFALTIVALATVIVPMLLSSGASVEDARGGAVDSGAQLQYIMQEPVTYLKNLSAFLLQYISPANARANLSYFAYMGTTAFSGLLMVLMAAVAVTDRAPQDRYIGWSMKILYWILGIITMAVAATSMYVAYTPYMAATVNGCQYRYLTELMFPALFFAGAFPIPALKRGRGIYNSVVLGVASYILLFSLWSLFLRTF